MPHLTQGINGDTLVVTVSECKENMRVSNTDDDIHIGNLVLAATTHIESLLGYNLLSIEEQHYFQYLQYVFELPISEYTSISDVVIEYKSAGSVTYNTVVPPINYYIDVSDCPTTIRRDENQELPLDVDTSHNPVRITLNQGLSAVPANIPQIYKQAILLLVTHWYEERNLFIVGTIATKIQITLENILAPYRLVHI